MSFTIEKCIQAWTYSLRQMNVKADVVFFDDSLTFKESVLHKVLTRDGIHLNPLGYELWHQLLREK